MRTPNRKVENGGWITAKPRLPLCIVILRPQMNQVNNVRGEKGEKYIPIAEALVRSKIPGGSGIECQNARTLRIEQRKEVFTAATPFNKYFGCFSDLADPGWLSDF